ncbi:MAG: TetR/AcrR family transcriptional regulator [Anaerofustis sp.]
MSYQKSNETKQKILASAAKLFYERGYRETTVRDIVTDADVSLSRLNYHFASKADLAGVICRTFLGNLNSEITWLITPYTDELMLRDSIHIGCWAMIFFSNEQCMEFYYELAKEDVLRQNLIESDYQHFLEQTDYLNLGLPPEKVRGYAHIFVAVIIELVVAKREEDLKLSVREIVDLYNELHLKLLEIEPGRRSTLIAEADRYMAHIRYEIHDLMNLTLYYVD